MKDPTLSVICCFNDVQPKAKKECYYIQCLWAALTFTSNSGSRKVVAQVSREAGFHSGMRESVNFKLEVCL